MTDLPTVSVIIAVRNGAATLERALDSVLEQTYERVELIVMDGSSTDGTVDILRRCADRIAFWESEPDRGICHAWNKALQRATGEWIYFLGADDRLHGPDVVTLAINALQGTDHRVAYGEVHVVDGDGTVRRTEGRPWGEIRSVMPLGMIIPHQAAFHRRALFDQVGTFDERFRIAGDYELLLRDVLAHDPVFLEGLVVAEMGDSGLSNRPENVVTMIREMEQARVMHGLTKYSDWRSGRVVRAEIRARVTQWFGPAAADRLARVYRRARGRART